MENKNKKLGQRLSLPLPLPLGDPYGRRPEGFIKLGGRVNEKINKKAYN
jgi:hypothetical protein